MVEALDNVEPHELDIVFDTIDIKNTNQISYVEFKAFYNTLGNMTDEMTRRRTESIEGAKNGKDHKKAGTGDDDDTEHSRKKHKHSH